MNKYPSAHMSTLQAISKYSCGVSLLFSRPLLRQSSNVTWFSLFMCDSRAESRNGWTCEGGWETWQSFGSAEDFSFVLEHHWKGRAIQCSQLLHSFPFAIIKCLNVWPRLPYLGFSWLCIVLRRPAFFSFGEAQSLWVFLSVPKLNNTNITIFQKFFKIYTQTKECKVSLGRLHVRQLQFLLFESNLVQVVQADKDAWHAVCTHLL